jgi:hypothetical protein
MSHDRLLWILPFLAGIWINAVLFGVFMVLVCRWQMTVAGTEKGWVRGVVVSPLSRCELKRVVNGYSSAGQAAIAYCTGEWAEDIKGRGADEQYFLFVLHIGATGYSIAYQQYMFAVDSGNTGPLLTYRVRLCRLCIATLAPEGSSRKRN